MARETQPRVAAAPLPAPVSASTEPASTEPASAVRFLEPRVGPIEKATDLGSVQVLKHGNMFLLTDQFGDIHSDSRGLGLYRNDTRLLSCSVLRVGGARPVVLQGSTGSNYRGVIQLTNPTLDRNPDDKIRPGQGLVGRKLGITRERLVSGDVLQERITIVNFAEDDETVEVTLELADDAADIFEVRGYPRDRGTLMPIAADDERATFRYDGLDGHRSRIHVAFSEPGSLQAVRPDDGRDLGGAVRYTWSWPLGAGASHELSWRVWSSDGPSPSGERDAGGEDGDRADGDATAALFPDAPRIAPDDGQAAYHAWTRSTTAVATDNELINLN